MNLPSEVIVTANILLFSPLIILSTTPLAGDTNITTSLYLSQKTGLPHFTKSPSLTSNFGVKLGKSEGFKAKDLDKLPSAIILLGTPFILISRPFLTVIFINDEN